MRSTFYLPYFGFIDPGNIVVDAKFNFLSIILPRYGTLEIGAGKFAKWLPQLIFGWGPVLK